MTVTGRERPFRAELLWFLFVQKHLMVFRVDTVLCLADRVSLLFISSSLC